MCSCGQRAVRTQTPDQLQQDLSQYGGVQYPVSVSAGAEPPVPQPTPEPELVTK